MRLEPKDFQAVKIDELVAAVRDVSSSVRRKPQTVVLSATTGAGKTVMATAMIERLMFGDDGHPDNPNATVLWISDQPRINRQSQQRMVETSDEIDDLITVFVDRDFDQPVFDPGKVYFLNTQKLGSDKKLISKSDERQYTIWETVNKTIGERPEDFYVVIDEAHRGMNGGSSDSGRRTIIQSFLFGSDELNQVPLVIGISATPQRFLDMVESKRAVETIEVPSVDVRESGLIKDQIVLKFNDDDQQSEFTLLAAAARSWQRYRDEWREYCEAQDEPVVVPKLIIQVEDALSKSKAATRTELDACIETINSALDAPLPPAAFAHSFESGTLVEAGGHHIRHVDAEKITKDEHVRVVFFKTALSTGWDCPPAEVMMSFRRAKDETYIAQLIGRMVRTPLARQVEANEFLNSVDLFLPFFDQDNVDRIVARLTAEDFEYVPPTDVTKMSVTLKRADGTEKVFELLETLPTYEVPRRYRPKQTTRLVRLATYLARDEIDNDAPDVAEDELVSLLEQQLQAKLKEPDFATKVSGKGVIDVGQKVFGMRDLHVTELASQQLAANSRDIDRIFQQAGGRVGEGLHVMLWKKLTAEVDITTAEGLEDVTIAKAQIVQLLADPNVTEEVEARAESLVKAWLTKHQAAISKLPEGREERYKRIKGAGGSPTQTTPSYPQTPELSGKDTDVALDRHVFVPTTGGQFSTTLTSLEKPVLDAELVDPAVVAWLRNFDRKKWSLTVPYQRSGEWRPMFPDFLIVRDEHGTLVVDLLDPHTVSLDDAIHKARGLVDYARKHYDQFDRIQLIDMVDGTLRRLDLKNTEIQNLVMSASSNETLRALYKSHGFANRFPQPHSKS